MYTPEPRPFTAATTKLAYAQAFTGSGSRRPRTSSPRSRRGLAVLLGRRRASQNA